ncbi:MAG: flagellar motor switch protein FliM [Thiotrichales bacterium]|jgi:flagellar motor switch protein FliM|nr:flagellar motor switch protein FliM [Thiotrichales bacterium]MBT3612970.1 flagellar motor switch protein FliM [Thiotrichales bacterium]MBT4262350.1 flagellar motor switch protein FliM [Thiotrichales bacterium]MBT4971431.1 flagellar motor switch protein FliM [Thiotrichales bacterium]MBT5291296.1 flagellar motor switch protein FliM [Thiotrichales bacterium]
MDDLLSQDEVDALLGGLGGGDIDAEEGLSVDGDVFSFDFTVQDGVTRAKMPALEMIAERFAREHRVTIYNMLHKTAEIGVIGVDVINFHDFIKHLYLPTSLNLVEMKPFSGTALITFDPKLVFSIVDYYFGGLGKYAFRIEGREFTIVENRVIKIMLDKFFADMVSAWDVVESIEFNSVGAEVNPQFASIVGPLDPVAVISFSVDIEGAGGEMHLVIPYAMLDPVRKILESEVQARSGSLDQRWFDELHKDVETVEVELDCQLAEAKMTIEDVVNMEAGDIIPIDMPESALLKVDEVPVLRGSIGMHDGCKAIRVTEGVEVPELILKEFNEKNLR